MVVLDVETSAYFAVNDTGAELWAALREGTTEERLRDVLVATHGIEEATAAADVAEFVSTLREHRLLDDE